MYCSPQLMDGDRSQARGNAQQGHVLVVCHDKVYKVEWTDVSKHLKCDLWRKRQELKMNRYPGLANKMS